ncbi:hypothetical protein DFH08DRAFT_825587 [Mycena albidolilacea]|uniref:Uncharacterized protein n=1 Tax=Mycena albidolilacea TaxID=1033008 RepID=A0AAD7E9T8_9AGAR|nr:hypothetical protein DFH08DRAFT_825587 [Mycena albidolilacea]
MSAPNYCNPPFHPDPGYDETRGRGPFWMSVHPDTRPPGPGIYTSCRSLNHLTGKAVGRLGSGSGVAVPSATLPMWIVYKHGMLAVLPENTTTHQPHLLLLPCTRAVDPATRRRLLRLLLLHTQSLRCQSQFAGLNLSSSPPRTSPPTPVHAAPHTPPRNSSGTPLRAAPHTPLHTPPSAPIFYAVQGGSIVHRSYGAAYRQLGRMREGDPSHILHASPDHVYTALIAAGLEPDIALTHAATHSSPIARLRLPTAEHRPDEDEDEDSGSEPELVLG